MQLYILLKIAKGNVDTDAAFNIEYMSGYRKALKDSGNPFRGVESMFSEAIQNAKPH